MGGDLHNRSLMNYDLHPDALGNVSGISEGAPPGALIFLWVMLLSLLIEFGRTLTS